MPLNPTSMRSAIFALAASVVAADVSVVWRHEKPTGSTSLTIHSGEDQAVIAESCGNSIGSLDFSNVDEHGAGNFTANGKTFDIISKSQDGISCSRKYNGVVAVVECSNLKFDVPESAALSANCFTDDEATSSFLALRSINVNAMNSPAPVEQRSTPSQTFRLRGRQQCYDQTGTTQIGDGDPHQNFYHKQISVSKHPQHRKPETLNLS